MGDTTSMFGIASHDDVRERSLDVLGNREATRAERENEDIERGRHLFTCVDLLDRKSVV